MFINKVEILFQFHLKSGFNHVHKWPSWSWSGPKISPGGRRLWSPHGWSSCQWRSRHQPGDLYFRQLIPSNGWSQNCFAWTVQLELQNEICETTKRKTYPSDMLFQDRPGTFEDGHVCCWEVEVVHVPRQLGILPCTDIWDTILVHKYLCLAEVLYIFLSEISDLSFCLGLWLFCIYKQLTTHYI